MLRVLITLVLFSVSSGFFIAKASDEDSELRKIKNWGVFCEQELLKNKYQRCVQYINMVNSYYGRLVREEKYDLAIELIENALRFRDQACKLDGSGSSSALECGGYVYMAEHLKEIQRVSSKGGRTKMLIQQAERESKNYIEDCYNTDLKPSSDRRAGGCNYGGHTYLDKAQSLRSYRSPAAADLYKKALKLFSEGCRLMGGGEAQHTCRMEKETEDAIFQIEFPELAKERIAKEKEEKRKFVQALRNYLNQDCSRIGLITKAGSSSAASTAATASNFSPENGYCVADNGLAKTSIGIGSIYDRKCIKSTGKEEQMCDFGVIPYCRLSSKFGNLSDNELVSKKTCRLIFPANYVASALISTVNGEYVARSFSFRSCPLSKEPTECFVVR